VRDITPQELARCDGSGGAPAYVAVAGLVYDVTDSWHWRGGRHQVIHRAGGDLTQELEGAPHGADLLARVRPVGRLVQS
jgi:predicted heme/steroid binding protein